MASHTRTVNSEGAVNARNLAVSARTRATMPFFWSIADVFRREPDGWELTYVRLELRRSFDLEGGRWVMAARLGCGAPPTERSGRGARFCSAPYVHLWPPPGTPATRRMLAGRGIYERLIEVFRAGGYTAGWYRLYDEQLGWAWRKNAGVGVAGFDRERERLEELFVGAGHVPGAASEPSRSPESLWTVLHRCREDQAGPWTPVVAEYEKARAIVVDGHRIGTATLTVKLERGDQGQRTARAPILAQAGVSFFDDELLPADRRRLRRRGWFAEIANELRRLGYGGEWYRFRRARPLGAFARAYFTTVPQVIAERRRLETFADHWCSVE